MSEGGELPDTADCLQEGEPCSPKTLCCTAAGLACFVCTSVDHTPEPPPTPPHTHTFRGAALTEALANRHGALDHQVAAVDDLAGTCKTVASRGGERAIYHAIVGVLGAVFLCMLLTVALGKLQHAKRGS